MNANVKENLLISCVSSEPFSTLVLNPISGTSVWSFKSAQGGVIGSAEPLGRNAKHLIIPIDNKPIIYITALNKKTGGFSSRSILAGIVKCLVSHPTGEFIFAAIENKIYTWMCSNGELLSIVDDTFQNVTCLKISTCGYYLAAAFADGTVKIYLTPELVSERQHQIDKINAFLTMSAHSLAVSDIHLTSGINPRVLSVSLDHTIVLSSFCVQKPLLKITADYPITACCMDPAETLFILGTKNGKICLLDLFAESTKNEGRFLNISGSKTNDSTLKDEIQLFEHHADEITKLCVNFDGTIFASSDVTGVYCIWDISNGQCLRTSTMKGKISTLKFVEHWPELNALENSGQKLFKKNDSNSNQFKFQQNFPSVVANKTIHSNFAQTSFTEKEKDAKLIEQFDEILNIISNNKNKCIVLEEKNSRKRLRIDNENDGSLNITDNFNDSNNNADDNANNETDDIIEINSQLSNGNTNESKRIRLLEKEVKRLMMINNELYEFAANLVTEHGSCVL